MNFFFVRACVRACVRRTTYQCLKATDRDGEPNPVLRPPHSSAGSDLASLFAGWPGSVWCTESRSLGAQRKERRPSEKFNSFPNISQKSAGSLGDMWTPNRIEEGSAGGRRGQWRHPERVFRRVDRWDPMESDPRGAYDGPASTASLVPGQVPRGTR